jgi:hypothetical protein
MIHQLRQEATVPDMAPSRSRLTVVLAVLLGMVAVGSLQAAPAPVPAAPSWVKPIRWGQFHRGLSSDPAAARTANVLLNATRYTLTSWYPQQFGAQTGRYLDLGGDAEENVRPPASAVMSLAVTLATGAYDPGRTGVSTDQARAVAVRLLTSLAYRHRANQFGDGWGDQWQSALWAADTAVASWLLWDELTPDDRLFVERMVTHEADRFLDYTVPYYQLPDGTVLTPGDTKAEENAWIATLLNLACSMLPRHPNQPVWQHKAIELMISAYSRPSDLTNDAVVNGKKVRDWLAGSNIFEDGTLVNHNRIHPDYMTSVTTVASAPLWYSLAGRMTPRAALFNAELIYSALVDLEFASPPYLPPGGTIYRRDTDGRATPDLYYPQGNDWGVSRRMHVGLIDTQAALYGFGQRSSPPATDWAAAHVGQVLAMQSRFTDGRTYGDISEDTYSGREQWVAQIAARAYLAHWIDQQHAVSWTNRGYHPGTPSGVRLDTRPPAYLVAGVPTQVIVTVHNTGRLPLGRPQVELAAPDGWTAVVTAGGGAGALPAVLRPAASATSTWTVTPEAAATGGSELQVTLSYRQLGGIRPHFQDVPVVVAAVPPAGTVWLSDLDWVSAVGAYLPRRDRNNYGDPLVVNGVSSPKGLWLNDSSATYYLGGICDRFTAELGINDAMVQFTPAAGSVTYEVWLDGALAYDSGLVTGASATLPLNLGISRAQEMRLVVTAGDNGRRSDWAVWGAAQLTCHH